MSLRKKIRVTFAVFAASIVMVIAGVCLESIAVTAGGLMVFNPAILLAIIWWRCPVCGKGLNLPFPKSCPRCGREIDYGAKPQF